MEENLTLTTTQNNDKEKETKVKKELFKVLCPKCRDEEGKPVLVPIKKDKDMLKEFKTYREESEKKYKSPYVVKRAIIHGCPHCGSTLTVNCGAYVDFYTPKKNVKKEKKEEEKIDE